MPWAVGLASNRGAMGRQIYLGLEKLGTRMPHKSAAGCCRSVRAARPCASPGPTAWLTAPHAWQAVALRGLHGIHSMGLPLPSLSLRAPPGSGSGRDRGF